MTEKHTYRNENFGNLPDELRVNPFAVPEGYFEDLAKRSLLRNKLRQDMEDATAVPEGYFDSLKEDILSQVRAEKLKEQVVAPGMTVPEGYFSQLTDKVLASTVQAAKDETAPVPAETPVRRLWTKKWLPYVAASVMALAVSIGFYFGNNSHSEQPVAVAGTLQAVSDQEIISYLELYAESDYLIYQAADYNAEMGDWLEEDFSEADIEAYFNNTL